MSAVALAEEEGEAAQAPKGVVVAPFSHSLVVLAGKTALPIPETIIDQLAEYMEFHTEARYPDARMEFYQKCTKEFAQKKFKEMKKVYVWLLKKSEI